MSLKLTCKRKREHISRKSRGESKKEVKNGNGDMCGGSKSHQEGSTRTNLSRKRGMLISGAVTRKTIEGFSQPILRRFEITDLIRRGGTLLGEVRDINEIQGGVSSGERFLLGGGVKKS